MSSQKNNQCNFNNNKLWEEASWIRGETSSTSQKQVQLPEVRKSCRPTWMLSPLGHFATIKPCMCWTFSLLNSSAHVSRTCIQTICDISGKVAHTFTCILKRTDYKHNFPRLCSLSLIGWFIRQGCQRVWCLHTSLRYISSLLEVAVEVEGAASYLNQIPQKPWCGTVNLGH